MNKDSFNTGAVVASEGGDAGSRRTVEVKVDLYQIQEVEVKGQKQDKIVIVLKTGDGELITVWQNLNLKEDGTYKNWIFPGNQDQGGEILPSISYEMIQLAKAHMGVDKVEALKAENGGYARKVFESLNFMLEVKDVEGKDGKKYMIPMFAYNKKKDAEYAANNTASQTNEALVEETLESVDNLPF